MKRVWIGLVHLRPQPDCELEDQNGEALRANCFVQVVAFVKDGDEFSEQVISAAEHYKMTVMGIEDLEPFEKRLRSHIVAKELKEKADEVEKTGDLRFGTFHMYRAE